MRARYVLHLVWSDQLIHILVLATMTNSETTYLADVFALNVATITHTQNGHNHSTSTSVLQFSRCHTNGTGSTPVVRDARLHFLESLPAFFVRTHSALLAWPDGTNNLHVNIIILCLMMLIVRVGRALKGRATRKDSL